MDYLIWNQIVSHIGANIFNSLVGGNVMRIIHQPVQGGLKMQDFFVMTMAIQSVAKPNMSGNLYQDSTGSENPEHGL